MPAKGNAGPTQTLVSYFFLRFPAIPIPHGTIAIGTCTSQNVTISYRSGDRSVNGLIRACNGSVGNDLHS